MKANTIFKISIIPLILSIVSAIIASSHSGTPYTGYETPQEIAQEVMISNLMHWIDKFVGIGIIIFIALIILGIILKIKERRN